MTAPGIPAEAFDFYDALASDNSKTFWTAHKHEYEQSVRDPLLAIGQALEPEFGTPHLFRPYRDIRFSKDKTPYKDHQGMVVEQRNGLGWYVQISAEGLMVGGGWHDSSPAQVAEYREAVAADEGDELGTIIKGLRRKGWQIDGQRLKTRPRGVDPDHPRLDLLRYRSIVALRSWEPEAWMGTRRVVTRIRDSWRTITPLLDWLADRVGPAEDAR